MIAKSPEEMKLDAIGLMRDPEFESLLPETSPEETKRLEESLLASGGPRDAICVWAGHKNTIIDGYRRHAICLKHDLPFAVEELEFPDRGAVVSWMLSNQLARRNLSRHDRDLLFCRVIMSRDPNENGLIKSLAKELGEPLRSLQRAMEYGRAFFTLSTESQLWVGKNRPARSVVISLALSPPDEQARRIAGFGAAEKNVQAASNGEVHAKVSPNTPEVAPPEGVTQSHPRDEWLPDPVVESEAEPVVEPAAAPAEKPPKPPKPGKMAVESQFAEVFEAIGRVKRLVDRLSLQHPGPYYEITIKELDHVGDTVRIWRSEETGEVYIP